jgi:hypothetical protein
MTDTYWLFLYTPIPYLTVMYLTAYRSDLGRIARRVQDHATKRDWWFVCNHLGLIGTDVKKPAQKPWKSPLFPAVLLAISISFSLIAIPVHFALYYLCLLQMMGALPVLFALTKITGPVPFGPQRDVLPFPRLGTRIAHLEELKGTVTSPLQKNWTITNR